MNIIKKNIFFAFFILFFFVFFSPVFIKGLLPVPSDTLVGLYHPWRDFYSPEYPRGIPFKNFLITDPVRQQIPWKKVAVDSLKKGSLPYWNPYSFSGMPLMGNIQSAALYPLNIIFLVLPFEYAWTGLILLQPLLAGFFMFLYLKSLKLHDFASLLGSLSWSFSGFFIAWLTWGTILHVVLWLPLLLFCIESYLNEKSFSKKRVFYGLVFLAGLLNSFFAGHAQIFLYVILVIIPYFIFVLRGKNECKMSKKDAIFFLLVGVLFLVISFSQLWQLAETMLNASRTFSANWEKEGWFLPWEHLVQFISPDFFGNPATLNYWGKWNYGEFVGYFGILPLGVFLGAFFIKSKRLRFWKVFSLFLLLLTLPTPVSKIIYQLKIPIFSSLQPTRILSIFTFSACVLVAYGAHEFLVRELKLFQKKAMVILVSIVLFLWVIAILLPKVQTSEVLAAHFSISIRNLIIPSLFVFLAAAFFFIQQRISKKLFLALTLVVTSIDLLRFGWKFTPFTPREYFFPETKIITYLKNQKRPFRVLATDDRILPPNVSSYYSIETISGYDPLLSRQYEELIGAIESSSTQIQADYGFNRIITPKNHVGLYSDLFDVKYILSFDELNENNLSFVMSEGLTRLYEIKKGKNRAFLAENLFFANSKEDALSILLRDDFLDSRSAVLMDSLPLESLPLDSDELAEIEFYSENTFTVRTNTLKDRLLVISTTYYPSWKAYVNGSSVPIYIANYAFMSVVVPKGNNIVTFKYE